MTRLRANLFYREGSLSTVLPILPYLPLSTDDSDSLSYNGREGKRHGRGNLYSSGYGVSMIWLVVMVIEATVAHRYIYQP